MLSQITTPQLFQCTGHMASIFCKVIAYTTCAIKVFAVNMLAVAQSAAKENQARSGQDSLSVDVHCFKTVKSVYMTCLFTVICNIKKTKQDALDWQSCPACSMQ